jgi:hypothetical protein
VGANVKPIWDVFLLSMLDGNHGNQVVFIVYVRLQSLITFETIGGFS